MTQVVYPSSFETSDYLKFTKFESASVSDNYSLVVSKTYEIYAASLPLLSITMPKKGDIYKVFYPSGANNPLTIIYYNIDSVSIERTGNPLPEGKIEVVVKLSMSLFSVKEDEPEEPFPWELPVYNYQVSSEALEQSLVMFYPDEDDPLVSDIDSDGRLPFTNTAGTPLNATIPRPLIRMSFSYNITEADYNGFLDGNSMLDRIAYYVGRVNSSTIVIAGTTFSAYMVRIESLSASYQKSTTKRYVNNVLIDVPSNYYRIDVSLMIDPETWCRQWLNIGTWVLDNTNGGMGKLWTWTEEGRRYVDTYAEYLASGATDGEEVNEDMFLSDDGTQVNPVHISTGRQVPSYRSGLAYSIDDFSGLYLPTYGPEGF